MAVWKADFDMSFGGEGSKRPGTGSRKAALEAGKQELRGKVSRALQKLCDRDTQQGAIDELQRLSKELKSEHTSVILAQLFDFEDAKNSFARAQASRLFGIIAQTQFNAARRNIGKMVETLCARMRDLDSSVRDSCAETIGELARLVCSVETAQPADDTVDLDASVMSTSILNEEKSPSLEIFFKPLFHGMSSADSNQQQGCALALAHVFFKAGKKIEPYLEAVSKRILEKMDSAQFSGRPQLLNAIANVIEVYPDGITPLVRYFMPRIFNAALNPDWNTRKHAMETIETVAARLDSACLLNFKQEICAIVDKNKFDKVKPVRDAALQAFQTLSEKSLLDAPERPPACETPRQDPRANDENANTHARQFAAAQAAGAAAPGTPPARAPMHQLQSASVNRIRADAAGEPFSKPAAPAGDAAPAPAPAPGAGELMPTRETWERLLMHFDRMTQQQTQLIEMVSGFGDSARERLETVEQKVFALELRLATMENRQSLPGMPPTPSRAVSGGGFGGGGTPAPASAVKKMNPLSEEPETPPAAAVDADFCT